MDAVTSTGVGTLGRQLKLISEIDVINYGS